jgi:hypothetical protein
MVLVKGYLFQRNLMWKPDVSLSRHFDIKSKRLSYLKKENLKHL